MANRQPFNENLRQSGTRYSASAEPISSQTRQAPRQQVLQCGEACHTIVELILLRKDGHLSPAMFRNILPTLILLCTLFGTNQAAAEDPPPAPVGPIYVELGAPMVANVYEQGVMHFVSIEVVALVSDRAGEGLILDYLPVIRHDLLMLYSGQDYLKLYQVDTKKALLDQTLAAMRAIFMAEVKKPVVEGVFFNSFVIQ